jgi:hypothetical protein
MPSLFIPKVFINITQRTIIKTVKKLNLGNIESVVMIKHTSRTGELYNSVIINIIWNKDPSSRNVRNNLLNGCEVTIMYDNPWFWKVVAYKIASIKNSMKFENKRQPPPTPTPAQTHGRDNIEINENTDEFGRDIIRHVKKPILKRGDDVCTFKSIMKRIDNYKQPINWSDVYSSDDEDAYAYADTDAELNMICDLMPQLYIRPHTPDYPPPDYVRPTTPDFPPQREKQTRPNRFLDVDNLNDDENRFIIDYSGALPVPQKIKRKIVKNK